MLRYRPIPRSIKMSCRKDFPSLDLYCKRILNYILEPIFYAIKSHFKCPVEDIYRICFLSDSAYIILLRNGKSVSGQNFISDKYLIRLSTLLIRSIDGDIGLDSSSQIHGNFSYHDSHFSFTFILSDASYVLTMEQNIITDLEYWLDNDYFSRDDFSYFCDYITNGKKNIIVAGIKDIDVQFFFNSCIKFLIFQTNKIVFILNHGIIYETFKLKNCISTSMKATDSPEDVAKRVSSIDPSLVIVKDCNTLSFFNTFENITDRGYRCISSILVTVNFEFPSFYKRPYNTDVVFIDNGKVFIDSQ